MPCLPCLLTLNRIRLPTIQHLVSGYTREGHLRTYSSCDWHHMGVKAYGWSRQDMSGLLGPSLTMGKRTFQSEYGAESDLIKVQDMLLEAFAVNPWLSYDVPTAVSRRAREFWTEMKRI